MRKFHREMLGKIRALGVQDARIEDGKKHKRLRGCANGRPFVYIMAATPSDRRAPGNVLADIRRMMRAE